MGFFRRQRQSDGSVDSPFSLAERQHIEALWRLTALPRDEFGLTYEAMFARGWRWIAAGAGEAWVALRRDVLAHVMASLRARQARIIPRFAPAEDAARLTEVMSFALAAAVLAERLGLVIGRASAPGWCPWAEDVPAEAVLQGVEVPRSFGALLLPRLIGAEGQRWVSQEVFAVQEMAGYFGSGKSELREIAVEAAKRIRVAPVDLEGGEDLGAEAEAEKETEVPAAVEQEALPEVREPKAAGTVVAAAEPESVAVQEAPEAPPAAADRGEFQFDAWARSLEGKSRNRQESARRRPRRASKPARESPETENDGPSIVPGNSRGRVDGAAAVGAQADSGPGEDPDGPAEIGTGGAGWRWINWVRRGYWSGSIEANVDGGWLYNIEGNAFVATPQCFEAFAAGPDGDLKKIRNQVNRLKRHRARSAAGRGAMSTFRTELPDGRRVEGMVFPGDLFWDDEGPPATDLELRPRLQ